MISELIEIKTRFIKHKDDKYKNVPDLLKLIKLVQKQFFIYSCLTV